MKTGIVVLQDYLSYRLDMQTKHAYIPTVQLRTNKENDMSFETKPSWSAETVATMLKYDPSSGRFTWKIRRGSTAAGTKAGTMNEKRGITYIALDRVQFKASTIANYIMTGNWVPMEHIDGDTRDLSWNNLRQIEPPVVPESLYLQCYETPDGWKIVSNLPKEFLAILKPKLEVFSK